MIANGSTLRREFGVGGFRKLDCFATIISVRKYESELPPRWPLAGPSCATSQQSRCPLRAIWRPEAARLQLTHLRRFMVREWQALDVGYWQDLPFKTSPGNGTNVPNGPMRRVRERMSGIREDARIAQGPLLRRHPPILLANYRRRALKSSASVGVAPAYGGGNDLTSASTTSILALRRWIDI